MREFCRKAHEVRAHVNQTEPYSPWQNAVKVMIHELKKGSKREMVQSFWDDCL